MNYVNKKTTCLLHAHGRKLENVLGTCHFIFLQVFSFCFCNLFTVFINLRSTAINVSMLFPKPRGLSLIWERVCTLLEFVHCLSFSFLFVL